MMSSIDDRLNSIETLLKKTHRKVAYNEFVLLIDELSVAEIETWKEDFFKVIDEYFYKKNRAKLRCRIDEKLGVEIETPDSTPGQHANPILLQDRINAHELQFHDLSEHHIFQWTTYYDSAVQELYNFLLSIRNPADWTHVSGQVAELVAGHAMEIFRKGWAHQVRERGESRRFGIEKSLSGLTRFVDLPIKCYTNEIANGREKIEVMSARRAVSLLIRSILRGYSQVAFGSITGRSVLVDNPDSWIRVVGFLDAESLRMLEAILDVDYRDYSFEETLMPVATVIDQSLEAQDDTGLWPVICIYSAYSHSIEVSIQPGFATANISRIELRCKLSGRLELTEIRELELRGVRIVVGEVSPDVRAILRTQERLEKITVPTGESAAHTAITVAEKLRNIRYMSKSVRTGAQTVTINYPREFPLTKARIDPYYRVSRHSVRDMLDTFETKSGVRLWCSVRRSGKTTACFELGEVIGGAVVVPQTCAETESAPGDNRFYSAVLGLIEDKENLDRDFFARMVRACAPPLAGAPDRTVFILDEYERLFGRIMVEVERDPGIRYTVVQPLLDQMVAYSKDNLLVFLGQQPDAHYILMEQNQLSAYVVQDSFPLFGHTEGTKKGEFSSLLDRAFGRRFDFTAPFADAVYRETSGHPYLTVAVLITFIDYLMNVGTIKINSKMTDVMFDRFCHNGLSKGVIRRANEYAFFRNAVSEGISEFGARTAPWIYAVYRSIKNILCVNSNMSVGVEDFVGQLNDNDCFGTGLVAEDVLRTGLLSNFFIENRGNIAPKIRVLARIADAVVPRGKS